VDELIELEHAGWRSLCDGTGDDFYARAMADDGLMVLANGAVMTRDQVVDALGQSPPWASYEMEDVRVLPLGEDAAALVYVGTGRRDGDDPPFVGVMSSVYIRRRGEWKLALYQQTPST
jgi:hypothetical protein